MHSKLAPTWLSVCVCGLLVGFSWACRSTARPEPSTSARYENVVPLDYVVTPHGLFHKSCVHEVNAGAHIDAEGTVIAPSGLKFQLGACQFPVEPYATREVRVKPPVYMVTPADIASMYTTMGWDEATFWLSGSRLGSMTASFAVPKAPKHAGEALFLWFGTRSSDGHEIIQPVLQYGPKTPSGGNVWTMSGWICCPVGNDVYSTPLQVYAGDQLAGRVERRTCGPTTCDWEVAVTDVRLGQTTGFSNDTSKDYICQIGGAVESYGVVDCDGYPEDGSTTFSGIAMLDEGGAQLQANWSDFPYGGGLVNCTFGLEHSVADTVKLIY